MEKYWCYVAVIIIKNVSTYYEGYVSSKDYFPGKAAKLQATQYGVFPASSRKNHLLASTFVINQYEVAKSEYEAWKTTMKF